MDFVASRNKINFANGLKNDDNFGMISRFILGFFARFSIGNAVILRRYLTSQVATTTALVLGFLVVMLLGGRLIRYFGMAAEGGLDVGVLFSLIGYNLPYFLELILPLSFFIGLMLTFGRMYSDHEMAIINGSGIGRGKLARLLIPLVLILIIIEGWITLVAKPWGMERASNIFQEQSVGKLFEMIRPKSFISSGDYHLYVGKLGVEQELLEDVILVQMPKSKSGEMTSAKQGDTLIFAKSASQVPSDDGAITLDLHQGRRYEVSTDSRRYSQIGFERYRITLSAQAKDETAPMRIEGVSTPQLLELLAGVGHRQNLNEVRAELGYRLSLPWLMLLAIMLAVPLSQVRPRQGRWLKLIPAIFLFVANVLILISLKESITKGKISALSYPLAVVVLLIFALYLNYHQHLMARVRLKRHLSEPAS